jgi:hypothetical protein
MPAFSTCNLPAGLPFSPFAHSGLAAVCTSLTVLLCLFVVSVFAEWQGALPCARHQHPEGQRAVSAAEPANQGLRHQLRTRCTGHAHTVRGFL